MADRPYNRRYRKVNARGQLTFDAAFKPGEITRNLPAPGEGFTIRTTGPGVGRPARDVLSVGFAPEMGRAAEVSIDPNKSIKQQMRDFNDTHLDVLGAKGASMAQGGWANPDTKIVEQDTSVLLPRTPEGTRVAMQIGIESGQAAIGNLGKKGYVGDIDIPHYLQKDQYNGPLGYEPEVKDLGVQPDTGRRRVQITPGLKEAADVHATVTAARMGFTPKPMKQKGAGQYVKESLGLLRRTRKPAR